MTLRHMTLPALLGIALCTSALGQQAPGLQQRMSAAEFKAAGLDKLSPDELRHLDGWLATHATVTTRIGGEPVFYPASGKREKFEARVRGHFDGWNGHTRISLDNGQEWKQIGSDDVLCNAGDAPQARLKPSLFSSWLMHVQGCNGSVHVERVK